MIMDWFYILVYILLGFELGIFVRRQNLLDLGLPELRET